MSLKNIAEVTTHRLSKLSHQQQIMTEEKICSDGELLLLQWQNFKE